MPCSWQSTRDYHNFRYFALILLWFCPDFLIIRLWFSDYPSVNIKCHPNLRYRANKSQSLSRANIVFLIVGNYDRPGQIQCLPWIEWADTWSVSMSRWTMPINWAARGLVSASRLIVQPSVGNFLLNTSLTLTLSIWIIKHHNLSLYHQNLSVLDLEFFDVFWRTARPFEFTLHYEGPL